MVMDPNNPLPLLALTVALCAYVGSVRLWALSRLKDASPEKKQRLKLLLVFLIGGDLPLIVSAAFQILRIFHPYTRWTTPPSWVDQAVVWAFLIGVVVLGLHHVWLWGRSAREIFKRKGEENEADSAATSLAAASAAAASSSAAAASASAAAASASAAAASAAAVGASAAAASAMKAAKPVNDVGVKTVGATEAGG